MKINKPSKKRTIIIISLLIGVLLLAGISFAAWQSKNRSLSNAELTETTDETSAVKESQVKKDGIKDNGATLPAKSSEAKDRQDTTVSDSNDSSSRSTPEKPQISRASQSGETIRVVALFQQDSSGYCELELSQAGGQAISRESNISVGPTYYVCSFDVSSDQISTRGTWEAVVIHHLNGSTSKSDITMVEVK